MYGTSQKLARQPSFHIEIEGTAINQITSMNTLSPLTSREN